MIADFNIGDRPLGPGNPVYIVAEMSANHGGDFQRATQIVQEAKAAGADALKLQTYTADTLTIPSENPLFKLGAETLWAGRTLYNLYEEAQTPWEWQPKLKKIANGIGLDLFSSPFDVSAVDFLEKMDIPAYKISSFELVDLPLIRRVAATGKPAIFSTGMATVKEIEEALSAFREAGGREAMLLKCTSAYPAPPEEMNLKGIKKMADVFGVPIGLSDHSMGMAVAVAAVALGASLVEKHFTLSRNVSGPDSPFSMEPQEFKEMVEAIRTTEKALGRSSFQIGKSESKNRFFRRSLFVVKNVQKGDILTNENVRSIRPSQGLLPKYLTEIIGRRAALSIASGTPLSWAMVEGLTPMPKRSRSRSIIRATGRRTMGESK